MIMDLCMVVISRISTGISGKLSGWMRVRCRRDNQAEYAKYQNILDTICKSLSTLYHQSREKVTNQDRTRYGYHVAHRI